MSYGVAAALQAGIYQHLLEDAGVTALVGTEIHDAVPAGSVPSLYISLGPESVTAAGDKTGRGARHRFVVGVVSDSAGFQDAKIVAAAVSDALHEQTPALARGRIVRMQFLKAQARRVDSGLKRRIDLQFEARVEDD